MGCDIHIYTEITKTINDVKKWVNMDYWQYNPYHEGSDPEDREPRMNLKSIYHERNYDLFTVLANVRNYGESSFMCEPKGLPEDISKVTKEQFDKWDSEGHSHSYFTLKELKEYQKNGIKIKHSGLVSQKEAKLLDEGISTPTTWCQGASSEFNLVFREWVENDYDPLKKLVDVIDERKRDEFWIWRKENDDGKFDDMIRIVFWFDN